MVKEFLLSIENIKGLEVELLNNGVAITNDKKIVGFITYEKFCEYGLIRYFIFQRQIGVEIVFDMFKALCQKAYDNHIDSLIAIGKTEEVIELFSNLGFMKIDNNNLYICGKKVVGTDLENAVILKYDL